MKPPLPSGEGRGEGLQDVFTGGHIMDRAERAELALRLAGVAFIAWGMAQLPQFVKFISALVRHSRAGTGQSMIATSLIYMSFIPGKIVIGACFAGFPGALSRLLLRPDRIPAPSREAELLQIGVVLLASYFLLTAVCGIGSAMILGASWLFVVALVGAIACYLIAYPTHFRRFLWCRAELLPDAATKPSGLLSAGLTFLAIFYATKVLFPFLHSAVYMFTRHPDADIQTPRWFRWDMAWNLFGHGLALLGAIVLLVYAGKVAGWFTSRRHELRPEGSSLVATGRRTCFELALLIAALFLFAAYLGDISWVLRAATVGFPIFAVALLVLARIFGPGLAAKLYREQSVEQSDEAVKGRLILEAAITVMALYYAATYLFPHPLFISVTDGCWSWGDFAANTVLPTALSLLLLAFRSDIAWLLYGRRAGERMPTAAERASALYPWLVLLGMMFLLADGPRLVPWIARDVFRLDRLFIRGGEGFPSMISLGPLRAIAGLILLFGAGWLSKKLSYGRLIPRIWPPVKRRGETG